MQRTTRLIAFAAAAALSVASAVSVRAEVKVVTDHNANEKATPQFKFDSVPSPSKAAAPEKLKIKLVEGEKDGNCRDADQLTSNHLPTEEDAPDDNFFFEAGTDGGRIEFDLGAATKVEQFNSYSWHPNTRGPQVYKLYAADGTATGFNAEPKKGTDPASCGWKLVASVDTRPKSGEPGGQYGVSVKDDAGALGTYRYFLMDCTKTEGDDDFGNTFYSKVDIVPAK